MAIPREWKLNRCAALADTRGRRLAFALMDRQQDAEDLVQQAMLVAASKAEEIPAMAIWPWLARVITFEARNMRRKTVRQKQLELESAQVRAPDDPLEALLAAELGGLLKQALNELKEEEREALVLVYAGGLSVRAAARAAGVSRGVLRRRIDSAMAQLRRRLGVRLGSLAGLLKAWSYRAVVGSTTAKGVILMSGKQVASAVIVTALLVCVGVWWWGDGSDELPTPEIAGDQANVDDQVVGSRNRKGGGTNEGESALARLPQGGSSELRANGIDGAVDVDGAGEGEVGSGQVEAGLLPVAPEGMAWIPFQFTLAGSAYLSGSGPAAGAVVRVVAGTASDARSDSLAPQQGEARAVQRTEIQLPWPDDCVMEAAKAVVGESGAFRQVFGGRRLVAVDARGEPLEPVYPPASRVVAEYRDVSQWQSEILDQSTWKLASSREEIWMNITFSEAFTITGYVRWAESREPAAGARVRLSSRDLHAPERPANQFSQLARSVDVVFPDVITGPDGQFTFHDVSGSAPVAYVCAAPPGVSIEEFADRCRYFQGGSRSYWAHLIGIGVMPQLEILLPSFSELTFRLSPQLSSDVAVDILPGRIMSVSSSGVQVTRSSMPYRAGADGVYRIPGLHGGHNRVVILADGYEAVEQTIAPRVGEDLDLGVIQLEAGTLLQGVVRDGNGEPIEGVELVLSRGRRFLSDRNNYSFPDLTAITGPDGAYKITGIGEGLRYVWIDHVGYAKQGANLEFQLGDAVRRDFALTAGGSVAGTVKVTGRDRTKLPRVVWLAPEGDAAHLESNRDAATPSEDADRDWRSAWWGSLRPSDSDGELLEYEVQRVPPGRYVARLEGQFFSDRSPASILRGIEVREGEVAIANFDVTPAPRPTFPTGTVRGRVIGRDGKPAAGLVVHVRGHETGVLTDVDGRYELVNEHAGEGRRVMVTNMPKGAVWPTFLAAKQDLTIPAHGVLQVDFDLATDAGPQLRILVLLDGKPEFRRIVMSHTDSRKIISSLDTAMGVRPDENGWVTFETVHAGVFTLWAEADVDGVRVNAIGEVEVPEGAYHSTTVNFSVSHIVGRVTPPAGVPGGVPMQQVRVTTAADGRRGRFNDADAWNINCQSDGTFRIPVIAGRNHVRAVFAGYGPGYATVDAPAGGEARADIQLEGQVAAYTLTCAAVNGVPPANARWASLNFHLEPDDNLGIPGRKYPDSPSDSLPAKAGSERTTTDLPPGKYRVHFVLSRTLKLVSLSGDGIQKLGEDDSTYWLVTVPPGGELSLSVELEWR